jgi:hypothetical protein
VTFGKGPRKPLKMRGRRALREEDAREEMRRIVLGECGSTCVGKVAAPSVRCWGPLEVHELCDRSVRPGVHLDADFGVALCHAHNQAVNDDATWGREVGLTFYSWDWEKALARVVELRALIWRF